MATHCFKKTGWIYIPVSFAGAVITLLAVAFSVTVFIAVHQSSHAVTDTCFHTFPYIVSVATVHFSIASHTSG